MPSPPWMELKTMAQSSTVRQMGPILSIDQLKVMAPPRLTRPKLARNPGTPHGSQGETIEPSVSVPMANGNSPAASPAHEPADDPLEPSFEFHGFRVMPPNQVSPMASSPMLVFAISPAPASSNRLTTVASRLK